MVDDARQAKLDRIDQTHRCAATNTALLVIDMQHGFLDEGASLEVANGRKIIPAIARLVDGFRAAGAPVIFTEFVYADALPCLRGDPFGPEHLPTRQGKPTGFGHPSGNCLIGPTPGQGPESSKTIDALKPLPGELVVEAHTYDKFYGTHLDLALRSKNIDRIVVTGVTTDVCVFSTIVSGSTRNHRITAATDAVAAPQQDLHEACLKIWENKFARLRTADQILKEIQSA